MSKTKRVKRQTYKKTQKRKRANWSYKILHKGSPLYASKKFDGNSILEYTKNNESKTGDHCMIENLSWFGNMDVAKSYATKETKLYKWKIKQNTTRLFSTSRENESMFKKLFQTNLALATAIPSNLDYSVEYPHMYWTMNQNARAYYEFAFAFGYLTLEKQYEFLQLVAWLLEHKYMNMETRSGTSILSKIKMKMRYYNVSSRLFNAKKKYNRLSFYLFDKYALQNLCRLSGDHAGLNAVAGLYQRNNASFWFPDFVVYKMNIEEYILFNPHKNLDYVGEITLN